MTTTTTFRPGPPSLQDLGALRVLPLAHPQGCRGYLLFDDASRQALVLDVHLDLVEAVTARVQELGLHVATVVDSHTHADHPSGAAALARRLGAERAAHPAARHAGVARHLADGDVLRLGERSVRVLHAPGHTPDHLVLLADGALFSGDTLLIGGVARTDFLGGDAGVLHDTLQRLLADLPDATRVFPGHDYEGRVSSTLGDERRGNPWLSLDRQAFVSALSENPPPRPANMDTLLRLNREGQEIPAEIEAGEAVAFVRAGGAGSVIDVRSDGERRAERIPGSVGVPLGGLPGQLDRVRATPAPRLLLCQSGVRAATAQRQLRAHGVGGLSVVRGGLVAYRAAGGEIVGEQGALSLERQVRIAAGALVVTGVLLGWLAHPALYALAGAVGAGLVVAGITDRCGMALLLARAPWNRRGPADEPASGGGTCAAAPPVAACAAGAPPPQTGGNGAASPPPATH